MPAGSRPVRRAICTSETSERPSWHGFSPDRPIDQLTALGLTYECFCTRREIRDAASAPHPDTALPGLPPAEGSYPGTCRDLSPAQVAQHRAAGRPGAV